MAKQREKEIGKMSIKEFREKGYLQEVNRRFFHPLGLALQIIINKDGTESLGILDCREDEEGVCFGFKNLLSGPINTFRNKSKFIDDELAKRATKRALIFNSDSYIEPIP